MKLEPVHDSSVIAAQAYDPGTQTLRVKLKSGKTYDYHDVSHEKYVAFTGAMSPGAFWNSKIKSAHHVKEVK